MLRPPASCPASTSAPGAERRWCARPRLATRCSDRKQAAFEPTWLDDARSTSTDPDDSDEEEWDTIPEGRRNDTLVAFAGGLRRQGMSVQSIFKVLVGLNKQFCDPPLDHSELATIAQSAGRYAIEPDISIEIEDDLSEPRLHSGLHMDQVFDRWSTMVLPRRLSGTGSRIYRRDAWSCSMAVKASARG